MFSDFYGQAFSRAWVPAVDIYETDAHEVVLKAELPDMKREDISLTFENGVLTLKGERKFEQEAKKENFQRIERRHGSVHPLVHAAEHGRRHAASAPRYKDGVLTIRLPQREEAKPKQIAVNVE